MTYIFRALRQVSMALWVGGLSFFAFSVTLVAFHSLPSQHEAAIVVRGTLLAIDRIGMVTGILYLAATLALVGTQRDSHMVRAMEALLVVVMLGLTAYTHFSIVPRMESDRIALGGDVATTSPDTPRHQHFDRLHKLSEHMEGSVLIGGLVLLLLAPVHQRDQFSSH
jgi:hypothetical protein